MSTDGVILELVNGKLQPARMGTRLVDGSGDLVLTATSTDVVQNKELDALQNTLKNLAVSMFSGDALVQLYDHTTNHNKLPTALAVQTLVAGLEDYMNQSFDGVANGLATQSAKLNNLEEALGTLQTAVQQLTGGVSLFSLAEESPEFDASLGQFPEGSKKLQGYLVTQSGSVASGLIELNPGDVIYPLKDNAQDVTADWLVIDNTEAEDLLRKHNLVNQIDGASDSGIVTVKALLDYVTISNTNLLAHSERFYLDGRTQLEQAKVARFLCQFPCKLKSLALQSNQAFGESKTLQVTALKNGVELLHGDQSVQLTLNGGNKLKALWKPTETLSFAEGDELSLLASSKGVDFFTDVTATPVLELV